MRLTTSHAHFRKVKRGETSGFPNLIHHCVNGHAGPAAYLKGGPDNYVRVFLLQQLLTLLDQLQRHDKRAVHSHLEHNHIMSCTFSYEKEYADDRFTYYAGARIYRKLMKARFYHGH